MNEGRRKINNTVHGKQTKNEQGISCKYDIAIFCHKT